MAELFTVKADRWTPVLRQFGRSLGKLIYFMDAACDLEEDRKRASITRWRCWAYRAARTSARS